MIELIFWVIFFWVIFGLLGMFAIDAMNNPGSVSKFEDYIYASLFGVIMWIFVVIRSFK